MENLFLFGNYFVCFYNFGVQFLLVLHMLFCLSLNNSYFILLIGEGCEGTTYGGEEGLS